MAFTFVSYLTFAWLVLPTTTCARWKTAWHNRGKPVLKSSLHLLNALYSNLTATWGVRVPKKSRERGVRNKPVRVRLLN